MKRTVTKKAFEFPAEYVELLEFLATHYDTNQHLSKMERSQWAVSYIEPRKWTTRAKKNAMSRWMPLFISPCEKFIIKCCFIANDGNPPNRYMIPTIYLGELADGNYVWAIQPIADISDEAIEVATEFVAEKELRRKYDAHRGNIGLFEGRVVLIDY